jgi:hypothetical protein
MTYDERMHPMLDPTYDAHYDARRETLYDALRETLRDYPARWNDEWLSVEILGEYVGSIGFSADGDGIIVTYSRHDDDVLVVDLLCLCKVRTAILDLETASATAHEWTDQAWDLAEYLDDDDYRCCCHFDPDCQYVDIVAHTVACHDGYGTCAVAS